MGGELWSIFGSHWSREPYWFDGSCRVGDGRSWGCFRLSSVASDWLAWFAGGVSMLGKGRAVNEEV